MTLAPTNEAVRGENHVEKNLVKEKKITVTIREVMKDVRIVLHQRSVRFCESKRNVNRTFGQLFIFCLISIVSSVNGSTLWILSRSVLVPH